MAAQWDEKQKLKEILEQRRMEGSPKEKKKVPRRFTEEIKEKPKFAVEQDTEEMKNWRELNQSDIDICWKKLAARMEEEVLDKYKVEESKRGAFKGRGDPLIWSTNARTRNTK